MLRYGADEINLFEEYRKDEPANGCDNGGYETWKEVGVFLEKGGAPKYRREFLRRVL